MSKKRKHPSSGFSVPDGYFESLEDRLVARVAEEPFPKESGFTTPEGYFDTLDQRLVATAFSSQPAVVRPLYQRQWVQYAAAVAVLIGVIGFWTQYHGAPTTVDSIELTSIEHYLEEGYISWDMEDITALTNTEAWEDIEWDASSVSEEHIESYLLDHIEPNTLIIE